MLEEMLRWHSRLRPRIWCVDGSNGTLGHRMSPRMEFLGDVVDVVVSLLK